MKWTFRKDAGIVLAFKDAADLAKFNENMAALNAKETTFPAAICFTDDKANDEQVKTLRAIGDGILAGMQ